MISDAVLVALITATASIICQIIINHNNRKKQKDESVEEQKKKAASEAVKEEQRKNEMDKLWAKMSSIEKKLDVHNGYAERFGEIEKALASLSAQYELLIQKIV